MDRTLLASRFFLSEFAIIKTDIGIVKKGRALLAKTFARVLLPTAVNLNHLPNGFLFLLYACHALLENVIGLTHKTVVALLIGNFT